MDLVEMLGAGNWSIARAEGEGSFGRSWMATDGSRTLFLKQGVNAELLRALADLDVSPPVIASAGDVAVQEFVSGERPEGRWIDEHIDAVMNLMKRYHGAAALRALGRPLSGVDYVPELSKRIALSESKKLREALDAIGKDGTAGSDAAADSHAEPTLTHGDPNTSNFILRTDGRLSLIDWDDARVSDRMRDIGPLLWWYVRPTRWGTAIAAAGESDDKSARSRIHWWAAARSIEVALWLTEHGERDGAAAFEHDAQAAARGLPNPRAWWLA